MLDFESGDQLSLNVTNTRIMNKAYTTESDNWLGQVIELSLGHYMDRRGDAPEERETVVVRPISVRQSSPESGSSKAAQTALRPPVRELDDDVPF